MTNNNAAAKQVVSNCQCHIVINKMRKNMLIRDKRNAVQEQVMRKLENDLNAAHEENTALKELIARMNREHELCDRMVLGERP